MEPTRSQWGLSGAIGDHLDDGLGSAPFSVLCIYDGTKKTENDNAGLNSVLMTYPPLSPSVGIKSLWKISMHGNEVAETHFACIGD